MSNHKTPRVFHPRDQFPDGQLNFDGVIFAPSPQAGGSVRGFQELLNFECFEGVRKGPATSYFKQVLAGAMLTKGSVCPIFWGTGWRAGGWGLTAPGAASANDVHRALDNIVSSPYLSFLNQYAIRSIANEWFWEEDPFIQFNLTLMPPVIIDSAQSGAGAVSPETSDKDQSSGHYRTLPSDPPNGVSSTDIWLLIRIVMGQLLAEGKISNPVKSYDHVLYVVVTPPITTNDSGHGAYHNASTITEHNVLNRGDTLTAKIPWAVVGATRYVIPFAGGKSLLDDYTEAFSHEFAEAVSDPFLDGVRLLPSVQLARGLDDTSNEVGDYAQSYDPQPFRRIASGESLSAYWSDWHGAGIVPERYPYRDEFSSGKPCPPNGKIHQYVTEIQKYIDAHGGDPIPILNGLRRHDVQIAQLIGLRSLGRAQWEAVAIAAGQITAARASHAGGGTGAIR